MNKHYLQSKIKSTGTAYLFWFFFGAHYAYLGKWGVQILYWITLGGFFIWAFVDLFAMSGKVSRYNAAIFQQIDELEKKEKEADQLKNLAMMSALRHGKGDNGVE